MKKTFSAVMVVIGTTIGSGFATGKEVAVYFSRFGAVSYFFIAMTGALFFAIIYFFIIRGSHAFEKVSSSKFFLALCVIISLIFTSSMFAGTINILPQNICLKIAFGVGLCISCLVIAKRGMKSLALANNFLVPALIICMFVVLSKITKPPTLKIDSQNAFAGLFFAILYCLLNFSTSGIVFAKLGDNMTKKQKVWASLISSLTLCAFLMLTNNALLSHPSSISQEMPLVFLSSGACSYFIKFVVFSGCVTTLFSLVVATSLSLEKLHFPKFWCGFIAVVLPSLTSIFGFGRIVSFLYPLASVVGIFVFVGLVFSVQKSG